MSRRDSTYERKPRDLYETPAWVTEIIAREMALGVPGTKVWEPAAGTGAMAKVLRECGAEVWASDIEPHPTIDGIGNFLRWPACPLEDARVIATNPPYKLAELFCAHAVNLMRPVAGRVAMLLSVDFDSAKTRAHLFRDCPAWSKKIVLTKRIVWFDAPPEPGKKKHGPSENHAWYVWDWAYQGPPTIVYAPSPGRGELFGEESA